MPDWARGDLPASIRTLAWCLFWRLFAHGCWVSSAGFTDPPYSRQGSE